MKPKKLIYYLEMTHFNDLNMKCVNPNLSIIKNEYKQYQLNKLLYQWVGAKWQWHDRAVWTDEQWRTLAQASNISTWVALLEGSIVGYYELKKNKTSIEILYFGLIPEWIGKGLGGDLLSHALTTAWHMQDARRVCVNTCSDDHPYALKNYLKRGMKIYKTEEK